MAEVYRARDTRLNRDVALKILPVAVAPDPERQRRIVCEARALSALNHANILAVYDVGIEEGCHYLVSELIDGVPLAREIEERNHQGLGNELIDGEPPIDGIDRIRRRRDSAGSSIITVAQPDETRGSIRRLGSLMRHYGVPDSSKVPEYVVVCGGLGNALIDRVDHQQTGRRIHRRQRLGGLLNYYQRAA
jgi:hypothetical protein